MFSPDLTMDAEDIPGALQTTRKVTPDTIRQKMQYDDQGRVTSLPKLVQGRAVYTIPAQYIDDNGVDNAVHLAVFTPPTQDIPPLSHIVPTGSVIAVPYVDNRTHRMAWSLTAESIRVVQIDPAPVAPIFKGDED